MFQQRPFVLFASAIVFVLSSLTVVATGEQDKKKKQRAIEIVSPEEGDKVRQIQEVQGKMNPKDGFWPVILVQPEGDPWYVQHNVTELGTDGSFAAKAHFGNATTTPAGFKFTLVIILAKSKEDALKNYPRGTVLKTLPTGVPRSDFVEVTRK